MKRFGHDLVQLRTSIVERCFTTEYLKGSIAKEDLDFVKHDNTLDQMLRLLSEFAKRDRYAYMNGISDPGTVTGWLNRRWEEVEKTTMPYDKYRELLGDNRQDDIKHHVNRSLVACLEKFLRALARLFVLAELGDDARRVSASVGHFLRLDEKDFGTKQYEPH